MNIAVSRTSGSYVLDDEPPIDNARKEEWEGINSNGEEYTDSSWVITVDSIADFVDNCAHPVIVDTPFQAGKFVNCDVEYSAEIYDDYRE